MKPLPPIPTPRHLRWRALRTEWLPALVFAGGVVVACLLWNHSTAPTLVAEAEALQAEIRSPQSGVLSPITVELLQPVTAGQVLGYVHVTPPAVVAASLAVVRAELALARDTMQPAVDQQRVALDYHRLKLDWLQQRTELAGMRIRLTLAENDLTRLADLHRTGAITQQSIEKARALRDALSAQVGEQSALVDQLAPALIELDPTSAPGKPSATEQSRLGALHLAENKLALVEAQVAPHALIAPIDGIVTQSHRRVGETVIAGEPILQVTARTPSRLTGFLRVPLSPAPTPGTTVELRSRTTDRRIGHASVVQVGTRLEPIFPTLLAAMRLPVGPETGLRIHLSTPTDLDLRPGEQVDVLIAGR